MTYSLFKGNRMKIQCENSTQSRKVPETCPTSLGREKQKLHQRQWFAHKIEAHIEILSVICCDSPSAVSSVQKLNSQEDKDKAYKYLNTLWCVLSRPEVVATPEQCDDNVQEQSMPTSHAGRLGHLLRHKCTLGADRGLGFTFLAAPALAQGLVA